MDCTLVFFSASFTFCFSIFLNKFSFCSLNLLISTVCLLTSSEIPTNFSLRDFSSFSASDRSIFTLFNAFSFCEISFSTFSSCSFALSMSFLSNAFLFRSPLFLFSFLFSSSLVRERLYSISFMRSFLL